MDDGGTQNTNKSFHNIIWQRCPKTSFVGRSRLCLATADATVYNEGETGRLPIFSKLGMTVGHYTKKCFKELDGVRICAAQAQARPAAQRARQQRAIKGAAAAATTEDFYLAGAH